jgi:hypothetical protein
MELSDFYNLHLGQTCLLVGLGPNLELTPPEKFNYPSIALNTMYKYGRKYNSKWMPTYFAGVDERLEIEDGAEINRIYKDIPKFIPTPDRDTWKGENFYRFLRRTGDINAGGKSARHKDALTREGIAYVNVMTAAMQIAWHMGFTTMLIIGMQHKPDELHKHFWGEDDKKTLKQTTEHWLNGYASLVRSMQDVKVLNISEDTYVDEDIIPRDDWRQYAS